MQTIISWKLCLFISEWINFEKFVALVQNRSELDRLGCLIYMSASESIQQFVLHQYSSSLCLINLMKKKIVKVLKWFAWNNLDKNFELATANFLLLLLMQTGFTTFLVKKGKTCFEQEENHESSSHCGWTKKIFLEEALNEWQFEF